jgi:tetratricopeptide (TPR) repeat protein
MRIGVAALVIVCFTSVQIHAAPNAAAKHFRAGQAHLDKAEYDEAITELKAALDIDAAPEYLFYLGQAYRLKKDKKTALDYYKRYLDIAPSGANATQAKVYIANLSVEVENDARQAAPPPPVVVTPPPPAPVMYTPPPIYDRKLLKQRLSICVDGPDDWSYCGYKQRTIGESEFIRRYHSVTGRADLDENIDTSYRKKPLIIAGALSATFLLMTIIGGSIVCASHTSNGDCSEGGIAAGITMAGIGGTGLFFSLVLGFPLAVREPRSRHKISQQRAQRAVDVFNDALVHPFEHRNQD